MTSGLRFRIISLQVVLIVILSFAAGFMFWGSNHVNSMIRNELVAQQITFPKAGDPSISAVALTPKGGTHAQGVANANAMARYAGQQMTTGAQAQVWADSFIKVHLSEMGLTYSQASAIAMAHPKNVADANLVSTIFKGTTLRGMLLNAYGWSQIGDYTGMAAVLATLGAIVVFLTLVFESAAAWRERAAAALNRAAIPTVAPAGIPA